MRPKARTEGVFVQEIGEETVIYDQQRDYVHRLNRTAAWVWQHCDGSRTAGDLVRVLQDALGSGVNEDLVWLALDRLEKGHLLQERLVRPDSARRITRREMLRKAALTGGATLLLPVVQSMVAPTPAMAMSIGCATRGQVATLTRPCCNGLVKGAGGRCTSGRFGG